MIAPLILPAASGRSGEGSSPFLPDPQSVLTSIGEAIYDWDLRSDRLSWSPNAALVLRTSEAMVPTTGAAFLELIAPTGAGTAREAILQGTRSDSGSGVPYHARYALGQGERDLLWLADTGRWFAGSDGRPARAHGLIRVVPARGLEPADLSDEAARDHLTGCLSRHGLTRVLQALVERSRTNGSPFALLLVGINDLVRLNKLHGYDAVDELLAGAAVRLRSQIRGTDHLARYAGNRFALLLGHCSPAQLVAAAVRARELLEASPIRTGAGPLRVSSHVGAVHAPRHGRSVPALLLNAELALDHASSLEPVRVFDPASIEALDRQHLQDMGAEIVSALNGGRVALALQPIVAARSGDHAMIEGLLRIRSEDVVLHPSSILPAARAAGLLPLLDHRVLTLAVEQLRRTDRTLTINLSDETLRDRDWPAHVSALLALNGGVASRCVFEFAESTAAADLDGTARFVEAMRDLGVRIAIDHFGDGHMSLPTLRRLRPDFLKIDGAFVQNLGRSPDDRFLVRSLIATARHLGAPVIAEWVENAEIASVLTEWGVNYLQGRHYGAAELPPDAADPRHALAG